MTSPTKLLAVAGLGLAVALAGCTPAPTDADPTPRFASEAEAFAAAEATYREYVKALNEVDLSDPETFEGVYAWTTGEANAGERKTLSQMHADGWTVSGHTVMADFHGLAATVEPEDEPTVTAVVCSDVSEVRVTDSSGKSMVGPDRRDTYALEVRFVLKEETPTLLIDSSTAIEDARCA
ncbi:hypothetical protein [Microbacterium sp. Root180]|uniref:hypothetical protein n=1 Tax=Microbacterium sp. Root180 TaxID=1736483 RepID=UPI0006FE1A00|nr:hypothetical protein [Microbacterium sp. Root180]KRB37771.1 hypothetical protein ASD93_05420 [Microbacterium sp. Root180]